MPTAGERGILLMRQVHKVIRQYFPDLFERMAQLPDARKRKGYALSELLTGCLSLFLFKETSRNALNNDRKEQQFRENYTQIFKGRLPHMDTVETFLRLLSPAELERLKATLLSGLIEGRVLHRFKFLGHYFTVAIDATGVHSYRHQQGDNSRLGKRSKKGVTTYSHHVVEAKLVTSSGLSLSLASEWMTNEEERNFDKQDCEQRAFERLAQKLKGYFPRLPICILADGLYPHQTFMKICQDNGWAFMVVLKDKQLKLLQQDITDVENKYHRSLEYVSRSAGGNKQIRDNYQWIEQPVSYSGHTLYRVSCTETISYVASPPAGQQENPPPTRFVWLTNEKVTEKNVRSFCQTGRMRWTIENEGFNTQKNGGYNLGHRYARKSFVSYQNYYQCMQIAHLINQLVEHSSEIAAVLKRDLKITVKHIWKQLLSWLTFSSLTETDLDLPERYQIRLVG
jgi:hypothetical protein